MMYCPDRLIVSYDNIHNREPGAALLKKNTHTHTHTHRCSVCRVICVVYFGPASEVPLFFYYVNVHRLR